MKSSLRTPVCVALLLLGGCGTTTFVSTWKARDAHPIDPNGKSVAALVISSDPKQRRSAEIYLANDLTNRGAHGIAAYTLIGLDNPSVEFAKRRFKEAGIDGVVIMRLVSHDKVTVVDPGGFSGAAYSSFSSYYNSYGMAMNYTPPSVRTNTSVSIETLIYSLNEDKLLWAGTSRTTNPDNLLSLVDEVADAVATAAVKQGLLVR